ncbi:murein biosynthesis integral membrane protein MurJ [Kitasatospora sp. GAS204B]|uniref:murein biosynthesis integral membrane protein MurJ n=1 Tax=unclassified Kitasatospora TaxID=2633591 RepID=UPI0024745B9D|nr:murein biosynthesis integral membrane protein MurJ [Kitasatospora sp. GAS204B]MDH6118003.1 putative peptidoglycan lipid II flippase [Kitasatospora sp. GAS204B]
MTTHTAGEPYGSYGPSESYGSAQPYPAAPTQGQADPELGGQQAQAYGQAAPGYGEAPQGYPYAQNPQEYGQAPQEYGQPQGYGPGQEYGQQPEYPQNPYQQQDPYQPQIHQQRQDPYQQDPYQQQPYQDQPYQEQQPYEQQQVPYQQSYEQQQQPQQPPYGQPDGYPQGYGQPAPEQYYAGHYREPEQQPYVVSEPYTLPPDYGMPQIFGDPPTMSLSLRAIESYAPPSRGQLPQQRESADEEQKSAPSEEAAAGRNGLIMAIGTLASRGLGFVRSAMLAYALGVKDVAATFNIANTLPNIVFTMLIGGALSSVFVPELVKAQRTHKDGGVAYTDRLLTLCTVALVALTAVAVFAAPLLVSVYAPDWHGAQRDLTIALARYCLPEILFYGLFTLLGQVLNARGKFAAMMWAPALNNIVAIAVFGLYAVIGGQAAAVGKVTSTQTAILGIGTTLGVVVQALGMLPSLRAAKFRWTPRFDWRGAGLSQPLRAASWALLLVIVTQVAFTALTALTTSIDSGASNAAYSNAYALFVVPQGVITISLVTAILPQMSRAADEGDLPKIGADLSRVLRNSAAMIIPITMLFIAFAGQLSGLAYGYGAGASATSLISYSLLAFAIGIPFFCAQYALARGFYAMSDARTPFWLTVVSSGTNVLLSYLAFLVLSPHWKVVGMASAQTVACVVSMTITGRALAKRLQSLPPAPEDPEARARVLRASLSNRAGSGLDGRRVFGLHLGLVLACLPGALLGHFLASGIGGMLGGGFFGNLFGLGVGAVVVLASLFVLAKPFGAAAAVAPLARRLRLPYPQVPEPAGRRRRR